MSANTPHLVRAILRCLPEDGAPVDRGKLRDALLADEWIARGNQHRLARLDSTLAVMSQDGLVGVEGDTVRLRGDRDS